MHSRKAGLSHINNVVLLFFGIKFFIKIYSQFVSLTDVDSATASSTSGVISFIVILVALW